MEANLIAWLASVLSIDVFYQHLQKKPPASFAWFIRNGDESAEAIDDDGEEPDIVYFDLEIYAQTADQIKNLARLMRLARDHTGAIGSGSVQDIAVTDQRDDYEAQASADTLPPYGANFRLAVTGYAEV